MDLKKNNVALIVHACDSYEFLYEGFEHFFTKNWDFNTNCNCYFATEKIDATINNCVNIKSGTGPWADRLAFLLREKITEKYVLYMQEDMWFNKKIDANFFNKLFILAEQNNWQQIKLHSSELYKTNATQITIEGFTVGILNNEVSDYLMSHQITLWNKEFLLKQLHKKEHPWRNELKATKRLKKMNAKIFHLDYFAVNNEKIQNNINSNNIKPGEYLTVSSNGMLNNFVEPFIKELERGNELCKHYAAKLKHNYINKLTHNGKPRPQKKQYLLPWIKSKLWILKTKFSS